MHSFVRVPECIHVCIIAYVLNTSMKTLHCKAIECDTKYAIKCNVLHYMNQYAGNAIKMKMQYTM